MFGDKMNKFFLFGIIIILSVCSGYFLANNSDDIDLSRMVKRSSGQIEIMKLKSIITLMDTKLKFKDLQIKKDDLIIKHQQKQIQSYQNKNSN